MGIFSPVDRDETKMVKRKLVSFATVVALWIPVTLLIKLIRMLLKRKCIHCKNYAILAAIYDAKVKAKLFCQKKVWSSPGHPGRIGVIIMGKLPRSRSQTPRSR